MTEKSKLPGNVGEKRGIALGCWERQKVFLKRNIENCLQQSFESCLDESLAVLLVPCPKGAGQGSAVLIGHLDENIC